MMWVEDFAIVFSLAWAARMRLKSYEWGELRLLAGVNWVIEVEAGVNCDSMLV